MAFMNAAECSGTLVISFIRGGFIGKRYANLGIKTRETVFKEIVSDAALGKSDICPNIAVNARAFYL
jgi:hypothetical protein